MAYTHVEKKRYLAAADRLRREHAGDGEVAAFLDAACGPMEETPAERFAYEAVLPALSGEVPRDAREVLGALGLPEGDRKRVQAALARLAGDGAAVRSADPERASAGYLRAEGVQHAVHG